MGLKRTVGPTVTPVVLSEMHGQLRVTTSADDVLVLRLINAATSRVEKVLRRALVTQTWEWAMDGWPPSPFFVPKPPLASITSIQYVDLDGVTQTWASSNYDVDTTADPGRIALAYNVTYPSARTSIINSVTITFVAGYGGASSVPEPIRQAITMFAADLFEHSESQSEIRLTENVAAMALLWPYKVPLVV